MTTVLEKGVDVDDDLLPCLYSRALTTLALALECAEQYFEPV